MEIYRFGVSIDKKLIDQFDKHIQSEKYSNRSEAIRDLIRKELVEEQWTEGNKDIAGAVILVYDHHRRELVNILMDIQHDFGNTIISTQHIHLDHDNCLEIIAVKGKAEKVKELANKLKSQKGVKHASLSMSYTGELIR